MKGKLIVGLLVAAVALDFAGVMASLARGRAPALAGQTSQEERTQVLLKGRTIFVEKCSKCHNERGDKALSSGKPLNERGLATDAIAKAVGGRLKDRTEDEKRAVTLYIASLMKANAADGAGTGKPPNR